jgi:tetratricopeptide (TPR) repeat protein
MGKAKTMKTRDGGKSSRKIDPKRKRLYSLMLWGLTLIFLFIIELALRVFHYGESYDLFIDFEFYGREYRRCNPDFGKKYFSTFQNTAPANDIFLKQKPENGYRIFVIGSSTVYGFPYSPGIMFSRILHERLQDNYPDKKIEVINTSITAVNSYTFYDKIDDILKEDPDVILIYAGHNEFYGAMGIGSREGLSRMRWMKILHLNLMELRIYQLLRNVIFGVRRSAVSDEDRESSTATLMERIVSDRDIEFGSKIYCSAHRQYRKNMNAILRKAGRKNVPVIISEVISNVRDMEPFCSGSTGENPAAIDIYIEARDFEASGDSSKAREDYYRAKDLDCLRFRAAEEINDIINELASKHGAYLLRMKECFENESPARLIGNNLLTEHVHPNIDGYFLMADAFFNIITGNDLPGKLDSSYYKPSVYYRKNWGFTGLDSIYADLKIRQLKGGWPFQPDNYVNDFIYIYKPVSVTDSLAYLAVRYDDISLDVVHRKMANYYIIHEEIYKAFKEYYSLTKIYPSLIKNYIEAGNLLFSIARYEEALEIFIASLKIKREPYVIGKIGEIYLKTGDNKKSISYLEEAKSINHDEPDMNILKLLYEAYLANNEVGKARDIDSELKGTKRGKENKEKVIIYTPGSTREFIDQALKHLRAGEYDEALGVLYKANKVQETAIADRLIGEILLQKKDRNALIYLKKAYYEYSSDPKFLNTLCYACIYYDDLDFAEKILDELRQLSPDSKKISNYEMMIVQKRKYYKSR